MKRQVVLLIMGALITIGLSGCYTQLQPIKLDNGFNAYDNYGGYAPSSSDTTYVSGYRDGYNDASYYFRDYQVYNYWNDMGLYSFYSPYDYYGGYYRGYWRTGWNLGWRYNFYSDYYGFYPYYDYPWSPYYGSGVYVAYNYYNYPDNKIVRRHEGIRGSGIYRDGNSQNYGHSNGVRHVRSSSSNQGGTYGSTRTTRARDSGSSGRTRSTYSGHNRSNSGSSSGSSGGSSTKARSSGRGGSSGSSHRGSGRGHRSQSYDVQSFWSPSSSRTTRSDQRQRARLENLRRQKRILYENRNRDQKQKLTKFYVNPRREKARLDRRVRRSRSLSKIMDSIQFDNGTFNSNSHRRRSNFNSSNSNRVRESGVSGRSRSYHSSSHSDRRHRH
ncbi:MAG TPA: hypothetical protein VKA34_07055 [Balneolales bacterium]|nr:hypothetical protein [Balneolales bacterium]